MFGLNITGTIIVISIICALFTTLAGIVILIIAYIRKPRNKKLFVAGHFVLIPTYLLMLLALIVWIKEIYRQSNRYKAIEKEIVGTYTLHENVKNEFGKQEASIELKENHQYVIDSDISGLRTSVGTWEFDDDKNVISFSVEKEYIILVEAGQFDFILVLKHIKQEYRERIFLDKVDADSNYMPL